MLRRFVSSTVLTIAAFSLLLSLPAKAQTLQCITIINPADSIRPQQLQDTLSTGSSAVLIAQGTYSDGSTNQLSVTWLSSDPTTVSIDANSGFVAALKGGGPVTITATYPGFSQNSTCATPTPTYGMSVIPQTALYGVTRSGLNVYDITLGQAPTLVTTISHAYDTGDFGAPTIMSEDGTLIYVAQFAPDASTDSSFEIAIYDRSTNMLKTTISSGLCYPSALAVKNNQLYVVNAGPKAHVTPSTPPAPCTAAPGPNVQIYDEYSLFQLRQTLMPSDFGDTSAGPVAAASSVDSNDPYVYIADPHYKGSGTVHVIDSSNNTVVQHVPVGNLPAGIIVGSSYPPAPASSPTHTVYVVGPGPSGDAFQALFCDPTTSPLNCNVYPSLAPINNYTNSFLWPVSMAMSPDGSLVYLADPLVTSAVTVALVTNPNNIIVNGFDCGSSNGCILPYSVATTADNRYLFASVSSQASGLTIYQLASGPLTIVSSTASSEALYGMVVTQNPEAQFTVTSQVGLTITGNLTMNGNFQDVYQADGQNHFGFSWNDPNSPGGGGGNISIPSGTQTIKNVSHTYSQVGSSGFSTTQVQSSALPQQLQATTQGIIGSVLVGPVKVTVTPAASPSNPINVAPGGEINFSARVDNSPQDTAVIWQVNGTSGGSGVGTITGGIYVAPTSVAFPPTTVLTITAISHADSTKSDSASVTVSGPYVQLNQQRLNFGSQPVTIPPSAGSSQSVTLTNTGNLPLTLQVAIDAGGSNPAAGDFAQTNNCGINVSAGSSCQISITFAPSGTGTRTALLTFTDNATGPPQAVALSGTGVTAGAASLSPTTLPFPAQYVGTTSGAQTVTLTNSGQANLLLAASPLAISGTNAGDFAIGSGTTCTASLSIAPNGTCLIFVTFAPAAAGSRTGLLTVTDNSGGTAGAAQTLTISGTGEVHNTGSASLSATTLTFLAQNVGTTSGAQTVTLTNSGQANLLLAVSPVAISGTNAGDFAIGSGTTCTASLSIAPSGTCLILVTFAPAAVGSRTGLLTVTDNSGGTAGATQTASLTGTGQSAASITLVPSSPDVEAGGSQQFTPTFQPVTAAGPVNWSVSGAGCGGHACGTINSSGLYVAPPTLTGLTADTVTATLGSNESVNGSTQVNLFFKPNVNTSGQVQSVSPGQSATYNLTLAAGTGDPTKTLTIQCHQQTLPTGVNCPPVNIQAGKNAVRFALIVNTTGPQNAGLPSGEPLTASFEIVLPICGLLLLRYKRNPRMLSKGALLRFVSLAPILFLSLSGCGTNGSFGQSGSKSFNATPAGTYSVQIDGVGPNGVPETLGTVTLIVQ